MTEPIVISGVAVGLPGEPSTEVFAPENFDALFAGQNRITQTRDDAPVRLAGQLGTFDLTRDYHIAQKRVAAYDITTALAIAAGYDALRDADIPLTYESLEKTGTAEPDKAWRLNPDMRDTTGVIFASAFAAFTQFRDHVVRHEHGLHNAITAKTLLQITPLAHAQFAELLGARGPSLALNAACAGTTAALITAADWLRLNRCQRVVVISADNASSPELIPYVGGGFLAAGAASTATEVTDAALPFDARRNGMVLGAGAAALVLETASAAAARGATPQATLVADLLVNSAFHGTRMSHDHLAQSLETVVQQAEATLGPRASWAPRTVYVSHETFTPPQGGSAAREVAALRAVFGELASDIVICNTKGMTGHPMGVCIEDPVAVRILRDQRVPPVPNYRDPDPALGPLNISRGTSFAADVVVRLAAGFGSQLALTILTRAP